MDKPETSLIKENTEVLEGKSMSNIEPTHSKSNENRKRENNSDSKRKRSNYNFWNKNCKESSNNDVVIKIKNLEIGKNLKEQLKIRITYKSSVRENPSGLVLNFYGMDETAEIAFVNFGKDCFRFYEELKVNTVYTLKNYSVEIENPAYRSHTGHMFQVKLNGFTILTEIKDEKEIPQINFKFISLIDFEKVSLNEKVDVLGILVEDFGQIKNYRNNSMRDLAVTDKSKGDVIVTLWGKEAEEFVFEKFCVVIIRNGIVTSFEGEKKINCLSGSLFWCKPKTVDAVELEHWFKEEIKNNPCVA